MLRLWKYPNITITKNQPGMHLACILLTDEIFDDNTFLRTHIISDKVNKTQIALKVLNEWALTREISDNRTLLDAMERSNDDAALYEIRLKRRTDCFGNVP